MQVKFYYLDGVCSRLQRQMGLPDPGGLSPMQKQKEALAIDDEAAAARHEPQSLYTAVHVEGGTIRCQPPYVHNEIGLLYLQEGKLDSALYHFKTAAVLAPKWAIPRSNLSIINFRQGQLLEAKENATHAIRLKPDFPKSYLNLGRAEMADHDYLKAEAAFRKAIELDNEWYVSYELMGNRLSQTTDYKAANWFFGEAERLKKGTVPFFDIDADGLTDAFDQEPVAGRTSEAPLKEPKNPTTEAEFLDAGIYWFTYGQYHKAEPYFRKVIEFNAENKEVYHYLGLTLYFLARYEEAEMAFLKLQKQRPGSLEVRYQLADVYASQMRRMEEEEIYQGILREYPAPAPEAKLAYERLMAFLGRHSRYPEQEKMLVEYAALYGMMNQLPVADFYEKMATAYPKNVEWLYRYAAFLSVDELNNVATDAFEKIIAIDTTHPAIGHIHEMVGKHYLSASTKTGQTEWETVLAKGTKAWGKNNTNEELAIHHFKEAIRMDSRTSSAKFGLVAALYQLRRFEEALPMLESLLENGQIDLTHRMKLAELHALSGEFAMADALLQVAEKIRFEPVPGLNEVRGKLALLRSKNSEAKQFYEGELAMTTEEERKFIYYTLARLAATEKDGPKALDWLGKALEAGFDCKWVVRYDASWQQLRKNEAFTNLLAAHGMEP
jgi:tetratricopeptide (TPR) repeat protein